ncbi:MAG TPA: TonB-dependent receptor, partial [Parafilimonas sp.]|nr:TonB-dependent receptor [Parafilimonas sp.]
VGSNNELTSQYSVRGGSYDENLIYVNDFEIYRPFLVQSGQQEGLSFINPELTSSVRFYNGGFPAKYGDKLSSALDVTYNKPVSNGGSLYLGLLEQGLHLEGVLDNRKVTYLIGVRNRSNKSLLSSQNTQGNYIPSSIDLQGLITWQAAKKLRLEAFANLSGTKFSFVPTESQLTSSVFTPYFSGSIGLDVFYEGQEKDKYATHFAGLTAVQQLNARLQLKWLVSYYNDDEEENRDISGAYLFGERNFDNGNNGSITNPLGAGVDQNYARNELNIDVYSLSHKGSFANGRHYFLWGNTIDFQSINSHVHQFEYLDSAGYSLPYDPFSASIFYHANHDTDFSVARFSGYLEDNIQFKDSSDFTFQAGIRYNYNTLNNEFLVSPRIGFSFTPRNWNKDVIFKGSAGIYDQPPFYREMVRYDGSINTALRSQKSWQASLGLDYNLPLWNGPGRITTEVYYKNMWDVVPYDVDNVQLHYYGENMAKAYAVGMETRLFANLVKDAESWISLGIMQTKENLNNDTYTDYYNAQGELITVGTGDKVVTDSAVNEVGWLRRPNDRRITFGMFIQDYLSTNKNIRVYFTVLYGSNLPYNIPGSTRYRNALEIDPYLRADIGFGALLFDPEKHHRSHSPFRNFKSMWASLEIFNVVDRANTISYQLIKDYSNNIYALPNRLTPRMVNFKIAASW